MKQALGYDASFWNGKCVFVTGYTGFKGSWLTIWLQLLGAKVTGYSLPAPTKPSLYEEGKLASLLEQAHIGNITDHVSLSAAMQQAKPDIVFHMAAQPLVRASYEDPIQTYASNVMGTVHVLEAARHCSTVRSIVTITTDKCYENKEWHWGYRETDTLGGYDPYSNSKACAELVASAYKQSFFQKLGIHSATARAGNVIGGGDWAEDRLIPDMVRAIMGKQSIVLRNPAATRPWQHVLEPLSGYMLVARQLYEHGEQYAEGWNFGPRQDDVQTVEAIVKQFLQRWLDQHQGYTIEESLQKHEAQLLMLDCSKANYKLGWEPVWNVSKALDATASWYSDYYSGKSSLLLCTEQIMQYMNDASK